MSLEDVAIRLWSAHKLEHNASFPSVEEERRRLCNFKENHQFIHNFNLHNTQYHYCRHNHLSHWSHEEYMAWLTVKPKQSVSGAPSRAKGARDQGTTAGVKSSVPSSIDWRALGKVTSVKNQGHCGSCWSFSAAGAIESAYAIKTGELVNFSEQQLVDCSTENHGCNGGLPEVAFIYVANNGIMKLKDYEYTAEQGTCKYSPTDVVRISSFNMVDTSEEKVMEAVANNGPNSILINASNRSFQFYGGGIYYDPWALSHPLDHAVLLVGYGSKNSENYWYVKNSWGPWWGEQGYVYIKRDNQNFLGVTSNACYPIM